MTLHLDDLRAILQAEDGEDITTAARRRMTELNAWKDAACRAIAGDARQVPAWRLEEE